MRYWENDEPILKEHDLWQNYNKETGQGILNTNSRIMFHPSENQLHDQCFNLGNVLDAFILVRMDYYRKYHTGMPCNMTSEEYQSVLDDICEGLWIAVNDSDYDFDKELVAKVAKARTLLAEQWAGLWL